MAWQAVWRGESEAPAAIVAGRLRAEGLRTRVHGSQIPARWGGGPSAGGSWVIFVPGSQAQRARHILREREDPNVFEEEDHVAENVRFMLRLLPFVLAGVAGLLTVVVLRQL